MVYSRTRWWHDGLRGRDWTERPGVSANRVHAPPSLLTRILLDQRGDIPCTCGVLIRKSALDAVGLFEEHFALYEDQTLLAKLFLAYPTYVSKACHAYYRQHPSSISAKAEASGSYNRYREHGAQEAFYAWLDAYVRNRGADSTVLAAIDRARARGRRPPPTHLRLLVGYLRRKLPVW